MFRLDLFFRMRGLFFLTDNVGDLTAILNALQLFFGDRFFAAAGGQAAVHVDHSTGLQYENVTVGRLDAGFDVPDMIHQLFGLARVRLLMADQIGKLLEQMQHIHRGQLHIALGFRRQELKGLALHNTVQVRKVDPVVVQKCTDGCQESGMVLRQWRGQRSVEHLLHLPGVPVAGVFLEQGYEIGHNELSDESDKYTSFGAKNQRFGGLVLAHFPGLDIIL